MPAPESEIITFFFTDIEGSTRLWEQFPDAMKVAVARHDAILRNAIEKNGGYVFKIAGDAFYSAFTNAFGALSASVAVQRAVFSGRCFLFHYFFEYLWKIERCVPIL